MSLAGKSMKFLKQKNTYAFWQTDNGIHCAVSLKEVVTVWIVVFAHQLDVLLRGSRVAFRHNLPTGGRGNVRNSTNRAPLCMRNHTVSAKGMEKRGALYK